MSASHDRGAIPFKRRHPEPSLYLFGSLNGVYALTRHWDDGDELRCRLCEECTAFRGVCTVMTEEEITDENAALYSTMGLDFTEDEAGGRTLAPFGLAGGGA